MKIIDRFLKRLGTSRNTFATYILTLITVYLCVDRIVEMLLMLFTGVSYSYWGPLKYTLALACPIFAFLFSPTSEFAKNNPAKETLFKLYIISLSIIAMSMFTQWLNLGVWLLMVFNPRICRYYYQFFRSCKTCNDFTYIGISCFYYTCCI